MWSVGVLTIAVLFTTAVSAQPAWRPEKSVEFIVPTVAGGNSDKLTRLAQKILQDRKLLTTPVVVFNRTGGNQTLWVTIGAGGNARACDPSLTAGSSPRAC